MYYKCELIIDGYAYNVSEDLKNWDDISVSYKRNDYNGVVRSFSTKFDFKDSAYSLIKKEYRSKYLNSSATIVIYKRNNSWLWNELFRCSLDFSTLTDDGYTISINAIDNSLASLIKSKKGVKYEYATSRIKASKPLYYDRIEVLSNAKWTIVGESISDDFKDIVIQFIGSTNKVIPTYALSNNEIAVKDILEINDVDMVDVSNSSGFLKAEQDVKVSISLKIDFRIYENSKSNPTITLLKNGSPVASNMRWSNDSYMYYSIRVTDYEIDLKEGDVLALGMYSSISSSFYYSVAFLNNEISVEWKGINKPVDIDVITPSNLLTRLLDSMSNYEEDIVGSIESGVDERLDTALIVAAESVRGLNDAKLYTSYTKFEKWMEAEFGFVPVIGEKTLSFVHRDSLYKKDVVKTIDKQIKDFEYTVNDSLIYSRVRVGYDKQDYDSINGRDEFRFTNEFVTGNTLTDTSLELVSPYRADAYGIEFLAQKRGQDTTDNDSDNDIFFVSAKLNSSGDKYELIRSGNGGPTISGVISPGTMFNAMYSPRFMIEANKRFIGVSVNRLDFASSEGNSDVTINGVKETAPVLINNRLFTVGEISFGTSDMDTPSDWAGTIRVSYMGDTYDCHVLSDKVTSLKGEEIKYSLIVDDVR